MPPIVREREFLLPNIAATMHEAATTISKKLCVVFWSFEVLGDDIINFLLGSRLELKKHSVKGNRLSFNLKLISLKHPCVKLSQIN